MPVIWVIGWDVLHQRSSIFRLGECYRLAIDCKSSSLNVNFIGFNSTRPLPLEVHIQSFNVPHFPSLMITMAKPAYLAMVELSGGRPSIIFVPSRKQCKLTANDIITHCLADENEKRFLNIEETELQPHLDHLHDQDLAETLKYGIGFYHEALSKQDKRIVTNLYKAGAIKTLIASKVSQVIFRFHRHFCRNRGADPHS